MDSEIPFRPAIKGRGAQRNLPNRFARLHSGVCDDGWGRDPRAGGAGDGDDPPGRGPDTEVLIDHSRTIVTTNQSPDIPFEQSINPYRGCEHGCIYCFARPSHEYLDLSVGQDFETRLFYKPEAVELLQRFLARPRYRCQPIALGVNTDAYQPLEKEKRLTRGLLETLLAHRHPVSLLTKGSLILRDLDLLEALAADNLVSVMISVTTLDNDLKRIMEPRTAAPSTRLRVIRELRARGIPTGALLAPVIPCITDQEMESLVAACAEAGAQELSYVMLRLPHQLKTLFDDWLSQHFPDRRSHVLKRLEDLHGGKLYDSRFGHRKRGQGAYAELFRQRFALALRRQGLESGERTTLRCDLFRRPDEPVQAGFEF